MISAITNSPFPVNTLLRQQTERQAQQAEQQAQALEQQAAAKRREARAAQQQARELDSEAAESANRATLLQQNLAASDRLDTSQQRSNERLTAAFERATGADNGETDTDADNEAASQVAASRRETATPTNTASNATALFNFIARPPASGSGLLVNLQV